MANRYRGEVDVVFAGKTRTLRPTFQALAEIEDKTDTGIVGVARRFADNSFGVRDVAAILWAGMRAGADGHADAAPPDYETVCALVVDQGLAHFAPTAAEFLTRGLAGPAAVDTETATGP